MPTKKVEMLLEDAEKICNNFITELTKLGITHTQVAGSIRRRSRFVGDVDLIAEGDLGLLKQIPGFEIFEGGTERVSGVFQGQQLNVFRAEPAYWGAMLFYLTGPSNYTIAYRMKAKGRNWTLNQKGLFDETGKLVVAETEKQIYEALGKSYKEPDKRGKK